MSDYDSPCQRRRSSIAVGEAVDAAFGEEGDSEEEDVIVNQVLDEIGISLNETVLSSVSLSFHVTRCVFRLALLLECRLGHQA